MKALLKDKIFLTLNNADEYFRLTQALTFENPKYKEAVKFGRSTRKIPSHIELYEDMTGGITFPRGIAFDWLNYDEVEDQRNSHPVSISSTIEQRDYQSKAINDALKQSQGVIVAPTGAGKTAMAIDIAARLGERCLILVKSVDLANQWISAIKKFTGLDCGLIGGGKETEGQEFTVGLIQTLVKRDADLDYGLVIVDECHNIPANQAFTVINRQSAKYRFGLSATPQRRDNLEFMIHAALGPVIAEVKKDELKGSVLPVTVATLNYDFKGTPDSWAEFINLLAVDSKRNDLLIRKAIKSSRSTGTALLTASVSHAEELYQMAVQEGVEAVLLHGQLSKAVREQRMEQAGQANLIIGTLSLLSEGIDWPHVGGIIFASPVSASVDKAKPAAIRLIQSIGRARRPFPGKSSAYVLDIIDNHPFGLSVFKKRREIYQQQGFLIRQQA